jgi:hypothetical protein
MRPAYYFAILSLVFGVLNTNQKCNAQIVTQLPEKEIKDTLGVHIETFTVLPDEMEGSGFYLFNSLQDKKKEKYLCVGDLDIVAYMHINGVLEIFQLEAISKMKK